MKVKFDFSELNEFVENITSSYHIETTLMTATQNVARVLHQHLLEQTPVDTGNLRKMWSAGENLRFTVERVDGGFQVTFINSASANSADGFKYGLAVNDGHRTVNGGWVMGRFFVENSIDLTIPKIEQIVMKELEKWWDSA
jgi:hypothetical protein